MAEAATEGEALQERENELGGPRFDPPLYRQRYEFVLSMCRKLQPASVVDMGCAECKLLKLLLKEESVRELVGVDIQASLLKANSHHLQPLITDFIIRRSSPLTVKLFQGSIAEVDTRLMDFDLLTCVEVIEHLDAPVLELVPTTVFGEMQPKIAIFTTPNSEFNVLFPNFHGFRHPDHRFEWTRLQFQEWCEAVCQRFPQYTVEHSGVGMPPLSCTNDIGPCSQIATFTRQGSLSENTSDKCLYHTVMECEYPWQQPLPLTKRLRNEAEFRLLQLLKWRDQNNEVEEVEEEEEVRIKLTSLFQYHSIRELCSNNVETIREVLKDSAIVKKIDGGDVVVDVNYWQSDSSQQEEEEEEEREEENKLLIAENVVCDEENWD